MKVAILGFGASSIFSIMACNDKGIEPTVVTKEIAKPPAGAFYYHWLPPKYSNYVESEFIQYDYKGTEDIYLRKQWGDYPVGSSSFNKYDLEKGYNPTEVFHEFSLHARFGCSLRERLSYSDIVNYCHSYNLVICTFPVSEFTGIPKLVYRPVFSRNVYSFENIIAYNGCSRPKWVRKSTLFGKEHTEYADLSEVPAEKLKFVTLVPDIHPSSKPKSNYDLPMNNLVFIGRFATVNRSMLSHEAYEQTERAIDAI